MHHIHGDDRKNWLERCYSILKDDGILVISDEFIRDYQNEEERMLYVAEFYCHIIAEALSGGFMDLAIEEAKNMIDDCFSNSEYAGFATDETMDRINYYAMQINRNFYNYGKITQQDGNHTLTYKLFDKIKETISAGNFKPQENFNRGDYKVSIPKFERELEEYGFVIKNRERYTIGPVDQLGGMGVLVFKKK